MLCSLNVDGICLGADVLEDIDVCVDRDGGVNAEDWVEPPGDARSQDGGPSVGGVVLHRRNQ